MSRLHAGSATTFRRGPLRGFLRLFRLLWASGLVACAAGSRSAPAPERGAPPSRTAPAPAAEVPGGEAGPAGAAAAPTEELVLLGTTDAHGRLFPYDYYTGRRVDRGLALLSPLVDSVRSTAPGRTFLFSSGDVLEGNPLAYVYARIRDDEPNPIVRGMNLLRYDAAAIGNHEFNYGLEHLDRAMDQADFPFLSANVFVHGDTAHAYRPYVLLPHPTPEGDTILVGVTGNTPPGVALWDHDHVTGRLDFRDVVVSVRPVVAEMRERGADLVVILSHGGLEGTSYDTASTGLPPENESAALARRVAGVDVIFLGHTHRELADTTISGVLLTQAKNWGASLAEVDVRMRRRARNDWVVEKKSARILRPRPDRMDRAFMDSLRWEHERAVAWVRSKVGRASERMDARGARTRDTPLFDFVNEVERKATGADLASTAVFRTDAALPKGDVTIADVAALYPYDNTLKAIRITGAQLRAYLEKSAEYYRGWPAPAGGSVTDTAKPGYDFDVVSGVDYTLDVSRPVGQRVVRLEYRGKPVRPDQTFTLALNNYRQGGGGGYSMIAGAPVVYDHQEDIRNLLVEELRRRGTISPGDYFRRNWSLEPEAAARVAAREQGSPGPESEPGAAESTDGAGADAGRPRLAEGGRLRGGHPRLRVLSTNDIHGHLVADSSSSPNGRVVGGAVALASYLHEEKEGFDGPVVLLDGGDVMQGTPISNLTRGRSSVDFLDLEGYAAAAVGNHEFDWGQDILRARMKQARFGWLSANILVAGADTAPSWLEPTRMVEREGVRVGILGLTTPDTPELTKPRGVRGLDFVDGAAAMDRWVPVLRKRGADFVVVVAHAGAGCDRAMTRCSGEIVDWARRVHHRPDLIVAGHTHRVVRTRVNGIPIVEAGSYSTHYGVVDLERISADSVFAWIRGTPTVFDDRVPPDNAAAALVDRYEAEIGPSVHRVVTTLDRTLRKGRGESALGRLIADAERWATPAQIGIINNGGIRDDLHAGSVTWGDLYRIQPFQNRLVRLTLRGDQLREIMEKGLEYGRPDIQVSGLVVRYDPDRPAGKRVTSLARSDGSPVRDTATYTVAVPDFLATGRGNGFRTFGHALAREDTGLVDLDAWIDYLKSLPRPVSAPEEPRFRAVHGAPDAGR